MSNSQHSNPQGASTPAISLRKLIASVFSVGVVLGTGLFYGYQKAMTAVQPLPTGIEDKYNRLSLGMTPTEARSLLGPGTEISQSASEMIIAWTSPDGYTIIAAFKGGKLVEKKQPEP